jgi:hypothetical protein
MSWHAKKKKEEEVCCVRGIDEKKKPVKAHMS